MGMTYSVWLISSTCNGTYFGSFNSGVQARSEYADRTGKGRDTLIMGSLNSRPRVTPSLDIITKSVELHRMSVVINALR